MAPLASDPATEVKGLEFPTDRLEALLAGYS